MFKILPKDLDISQRNYSVNEKGNFFKVISFKKSFGKIDLNFYSEIPLNSYFAKLDYNL